MFPLIGGLVKDLCWVPVCARRGCLGVYLNRLRGRAPWNDPRRVNTAVKILFRGWGDEEEVFSLEVAGEEGEGLAYVGGHGFVVFLIKNSKLAEAEAVVEEEFFALRAGGLLQA
mgnify:CR=1 FL=1